MLKKFTFTGLMLIKNCKGLFILLLILSTLASVLASFIPQVIGRMTEILQGREIASAFPFRYFDTPLAVTVLFIVCGLSQIIFSFAAKVTDKFFQSSLTLELKTFLHDKILSLDAAYHDLHPQNENLFNINLIRTFDFIQNNRITCINCSVRINIQLNSCAINRNIFVFFSCKCYHWN